MNNHKIIIYTDGAARGNPGPAGWGVALLVNNKCTELGGRADHSTNNIMELTSPIKAMKFIKKNNLKGEIEIHADSKYVINGINEWIHNWEKNGWRTAAKKPVLNQELWQELHALNQELKPKWFYVAGHSGHKWNDRVDLIATSFADSEPVDLRNEISE